MHQLPSSSHFPIQLVPSNTRNVASCVRNHPSGKLTLCTVSDVEHCIITSPRLIVLKCIESNEMKVNWQKDEDEKENTFLRSLCSLHSPPFKRENHSRSKNFSSIYSSWLSWVNKIVSEKLFCHCYSSSRKIIFHFIKEIFHFAFYWYWRNIYFSCLSWISIFVPFNYTRDFTIGFNDTTTTSWASF